MTICKLCSKKATFNVIGEKAHFCATHKSEDMIDVVNAFDINNYELDENIRNSKNGDTLETYICNCQKTK